MRALRVVGVIEDDGYVSVVLEDIDRQERFRVPADEQLRAAARGDLSRLGQISIELESQLRPREIQARIRAGASVEQVAAAAGVPTAKIERFAYPVLLERSRTAEIAQRAHPVRADGPDPRMLGDVVAHTFGLRGQDYTDVDWDSWKGEDGRWVVALSWRAGRSDNRAHWTFQPGAHGGTVTAVDEHASDLVEGLPARPLRTVGPVIDIARGDDQPAEPEPHSDGLRAAAGQVRTRQEPSWVEQRPGRVTEPRTGVTPRDAGPREPRPPLPPAQRQAPDEPAADRRATGLPVAPSAPPARAEQPAAPDVAPVASSASGASGASGASDEEGAPVEEKVAAAVTVSARHEGETARAAVPAAPPTAAPTPAPAAAEPASAAIEPEPGTSAPAEPKLAAPVTVTPAAARQETLASRSDVSTPVTSAPAEPAPAASTSAASAPPVPEPSAPEPPTPKPGTTATAPSTTDDPPPTADQPAPTETTTAPAAATKEQSAPARRTKKGKPVMPSWDEVLLGVRGQR